VNAILFRFILLVATGAAVLAAGGSLLPAVLVLAIGARDFVRAVREGEQLLIEDEAELATPAAGPPNCN
jgi:hypothetical protein